MNARDHLAHNPGFELRNGVYCSQTCSTTSFQHDYHRLRSKEGRWYEDATVLRLPDFSGPAPLEQEWRMRRRSANQLSAYVAKRTPGLIVEVGCGNGWLTNYLATALPSGCWGIDVNTLELEQAARVFGHQHNLGFLNIDLSRTTELFFKADVIVVAGAIQYFPDPAEIVRRLTRYLVSGGELHILDSPLYGSLAEARAARERSQVYFASMNSPEMAHHYFHHSLQALRDFRYSVVDGPSHSVFPWVRITV
jgi:ubiquinone/menaquinone biosynthesis C-methylase UbiE